MRNLKNFITVFALLGAIFLSGCQDSNSMGGIASQEELEGSVNSDISIYLPFNSKTLNANSEIVTIDVTVFDNNNNPYTTGMVHLIYPDDVKSGRDIGSFESSSVSLDESGKAQFTYTAPSKLTDNTKDIVFKFYYNDDPTIFKTLTFSLKPDTHQITLTSYKLESSLSDTDVTMHLNSSKLISFSIKDKNNNLVNENDVESIKATLLNTQLGVLADSSGTKASEITLKKKNTMTVSLESSTVSGLIPIEVTSTFIDINKQKQTLVKVFNVVVLSGPPTAISLSYESTELSQNAKFIEKWVVSVTDKYNNPVNTNPAVSMGMMAGYAQSSATTSNDANYLYYRTFEGNATLNGATKTLQVNSSLGSSDVFANINQENDYLITFGNDYTYNASGKWTIQTDTNKSILKLVDDYNGAVTNNLGFAVGHNFRQDACRDGVEWIGNVYPEDANNYMLDATGSMRINVEYDYYLTGKDVILWVNLLGKQSVGDTTSRLGEAKKVTLRGKGLEEETFTFPKGYNGVITFYPRLTDTGEWLKNANFGYSMNIASEGDVTAEVIDSNMLHGINYCYGNAAQSGTAYVSVQITANPDSNSSGTLTFKNLVIGNEF